MTNDLLLILIFITCVSTDSIYRNDTRRFKLNSTTRELTLKSTLDREDRSEHRLRIKVTNNRQGKVTNPLRVNYTLEVIIKVRQVL